MATRPKREIPESIQKHKYAGIFGPEWDMVHNRMDGNSFNFFIGGNGTGKSFAALKRAEIIGVDKNDEYGFLFDPDHLDRHVFFDKQDMMKQISNLEKNYKPDEIRGFQLLLDEAQMSVNAKDWNDKKVLTFSKDMTAIRSSRLSICMTMPTHRMITTDLRQLGIYQIEMAPAHTMNLTQGLAHSKIHFLRLQPHLGELWRIRPTILQRTSNDINGLDQLKKGKLSDLIWKLPSAKVRNRYEDLKKAFKEKRARQIETQATTVKETKKSMFLEIVDSVRERWDEFQTLPKAQRWAKIIKEFDCSYPTANRVLGFIKNDLGETQ